MKAVSGDSIHELTIGEVDVYFASNDRRLFDSTRADEMLRSETLFEDDFVILYDAAKIAVSEPLTLPEYRTLRHGVAVFEAGVETIVQREWRKDGGPFESIMTAPTFLSLASMLPGTALAATVQRRLAETLAPQLGLRIVECPLPLPRLGEAMMWHAGHDRQPSHQFLLGAVRAASRNLLNR